MLASAAHLIREHGAAGTSIDDVLRHSGAPRGSAYHHFPGGRAQLVEEVVDLAGGVVGQILEGAGDASPVEVFDAFIAMWKQQLKDSGFKAGCPVLAVAIESNTAAPQLTAAAARAFGSWREALAAHFGRHGVSPAHARRLATTVVSAVEGAVALSRVDGSIQPLDDVARELRILIRDAAE